MIMISINEVLDDKFSLISGFDKMWFFNLLWSGDTVLTNLNINNETTVVSCLMDIVIAELSNYLGCFREPYWKSLGSRKYPG